MKDMFIYDNIHVKTHFLNYSDSINLGWPEETGLARNFREDEGGKNFLKQVVKVNGFIQWSVEKQIWQIYYPSYKLIIILSVSNCPICDNQLVIFAAKWSFWRTLRLDDKYLHLCLIPLTNCICISSRQEEGLWVEMVRHWGEGGRGGGGGYHRNSLCNRLITYSSSGSSFCKRPSCKININNDIIIIINTIFTTTNQIKHVQACVYVASELLRAHMIWLFREGWGWCWYVVGEIFPRLNQSSA